MNGGPSQDHPDTMAPQLCTWQGLHEYRRAAIAEVITRWAEGDIGRANLCEDCLGHMLDTFRRKPETRPATISINYEGGS